MSLSLRNMEGKTGPDLDVRHPYRLLNDDSIVRYEYLMRLQRQSCTGQRVFAICLIACTLLIIVFFFVFFSGDNDGYNGNSTPNLNPTGEISVQVQCGKILGVMDGDAYAFKGIPYALPPTGERRWKPPEILSKHKGCWKGTLKCQNFRNKCLQLDPFTRTIEGDEDCLFLNVWTPTLDTKSRLPVVIYLHGGFLKSGSGNEPGISAGGIISHQFNIVFVSINYRLSALGFMALDILSTDNSSGNYGLHDQILALKWVVRNINKFGGDPRKITLFGHDSGATSVLALLASDKAKGLFHKAWLSSPAPVITTTLTDASEYNANGFLKNTGCNESLDCLLQLSPEKVLRSFENYSSVSDEWKIPDKEQFARSLIVIDGNILTDSPENLWLNKSIPNDVPLLIGSTAQEAEAFVLGREKTFWHEFDYEMYLHGKLDTFDKNISKQALHLYNSSSTLNGLPPNPQLSLSTLITDMKSICPLNNLAKIAASSSIVYRYIVTAKLSKQVKTSFPANYVQFSFHSLDVIAFFKQLDKYLPIVNVNDLRFQMEMQTAAIEFIRCGAMQMSSWKPYPRAVALISNKTEISTDYHADQCNFWQQENFHPFGLSH